MKGLKSTRIILLVMLFLLSISVVINIVIYRKVKDYYKQLNTVRLDPIGLSLLKVPTQKSQPTLVIYGDSRAELWKEPLLLNDRTLNLGIGGQTTEQILLRYEHHLSKLKPRIALIQAGINDLKTIPLFPENERKIIEKCKANLKRITELCQAGNTHVIISTIFPTGEISFQRSLVWSERVNLAIGEVNQYIESLKGLNVSVLVTKDVLTGEGGRLKKHFIRDFLHLNDKGYEHLNTALFKHIKTLQIGYLLD